MEASDTKQSNAQPESLAPGDETSVSADQSNGSLGHPVLGLSGLNLSVSPTAGSATTDTAAVSTLRSEEMTQVDLQTSSLPCIVEAEMQENASADETLHRTVGNHVSQIKDVQDEEAQSEETQDGEKLLHTEGDESTAREPVEVNLSMNSDLRDDHEPSSDASRSLAMTELHRLARILNVELVQAVEESETSCGFLERLPLDIRVMVYRMLLINPILGEGTSISKHQNFGAYKSYDLCPAVLGVNRQIREEASPFLYDHNTFYIYCVPTPAPDLNFNGRFNLSPLTRYHDSWSLLVPNLRDLPVFWKVKKWKIVMSASAWAGYDLLRPSWSFAEICRAISRGSPTSVEIAIIPKGIEEGVVEYQEVTVALEPLKLLRNIGGYGEKFMHKFEIRDTTHFEIPDVVEQDEDPVEAFISIMDEHAALEVDLTLLVQSDDPVEKGFEMYGPLLRYAQSFEKFEPFKHDMAIGEEERRGSTEPRLSTNDLYLYRKLGNPLKEGPHCHPVEAALMQAKLFSETEKTSAFKAERAFVLEFLEPQYRRMSSAASDLVEFIKSEKHYGGLLSGSCLDELASSEEWLAKSSMAMFLLEAYDSSFNRDIPSTIKSLMRQNQKYYQRIFSTLGVGHDLLEQLNMAIEIHNHDGFVRHFKEAVNKLDRLFIATLQARKELFKWDPEQLNDRQCDLDPEIERCEDLVNWDVNEPAFGPMQYEDLDQAYVGDTNDESNSGSEDGHGESDGEDGDDGEDGEDGDDAEDMEESDGSEVFFEEDDEMANQSG